MTTQTTDETKRRRRVRDHIRSNVSSRWLRSPLRLGPLAVVLGVLLALALTLAPRAEARVYWANAGAGTIGRANLDGSGANQSFITGAGGPTGLAVDATHIYWANFLGNTIGRANLDGSGVNEFIITGADCPEGVAVDATHIYWANGGANTIGRANLDGGGANQSLISGASGPRGVALDLDPPPPHRLHRLHGPTPR